MNRPLLTKDEVNKTVLSILLSEMKVADGDVDSPEVIAFVKAGKEIIYGHMDAIRTAAKKYMETGDRKELRLSLLPFHHMIRYEAYSPYWLLHCRLITDFNLIPDFIFGPNDECGDYTYYNDLIDMHWAWKDQQWRSLQDLGDQGTQAGQTMSVDQLDRKIRFSLPPTKGLIQLRYHEEMDEYYAAHRGGFKCGPGG